MPWLVSLVLHAVVAMLLAFVVWTVLPAIEARDPIVPEVRLTEDPGDAVQLDARERLSAAPRAVPMPEPNVRPLPTEAVRETEPLIGQAASLSANPLTASGVDAGVGVGFFGQRGGNARRIVFVVDASGSMMDTMPFVIAELKRSLRDLDGEQTFNVIFASSAGEVQAGRAGMKPGDPREIDAVMTWLDGFSAHVSITGSGNPVAAIELALSQRPELVFLLSDNITGQGRYEMDQRRLLERVAAANRRNAGPGAAINTLQFVHRDPPRHSARPERRHPRHPRRTEQRQVPLRQRRRTGHQPMTGLASPSDHRPIAPSLPYTAPMSIPTATWTVVADFACHCGENPLWHAAAKKFFWTEIPTGRLFWYDPATGKSEQCYQGRVVGGFTVHHDGTLLLFRDDGNVVRWWDGEELDTVIESLDRMKGRRWNDVMADPAGRVYCGSMRSKAGDGVMARVNLDGSVDVIREGVGVSNGMGFTPDGRGLYYTDTPTKHIDLFDYDPATGELTNPRVAITVGPEGPKGGPAKGGSPDGMICAASGDVFTALWGGHGVAQYKPDGTFVTLHELPTPNITSLNTAPTPAPKTDPATGPATDLATDPGTDPAPGGDQASEGGPGTDALTDVYVTSAGGGDKATNGEHAGALFKLTIEPAGTCVGQREYVSRIGG